MSDTGPVTASSLADPSDAEDLALVGRLAAGDETALAALYDRWSERLYSIALQLVKQPDRAEDVLEETFWQVWRGAGAYSPARKSVSTWLLTIVRRRSLERLRARPRPKDTPLESEYSAPDDVPQAGPRAPAGQHAQLLETTILELPDAQRVAFELAWFHGLGQAEISDRLGEPLGAVRTRLRLAMQKLHAELIGTASAQSAR
ncbi:MAG TPA: sigma-70 family RNA polymerase sigma factor [Gemmatimonadaceae bacterium]|nr:sigma-70 family RNA polymerase sigma factor [Gemmatimonadaceae bacterium]